MSCWLNLPLLGLAAAAQGESAASWYAEFWDSVGSLRLLRLHENYPQGICLCLIKVASYRSLVETSLLLP